MAKSNTHFDPEAHFTNLQSDPSKAPIDYLETKWRIVWFRTEHPTGRIYTELLLTEPTIIFKATIYAEDGRDLGIGHGSAPSFGKGKGKWVGREIEKAETAAIGRALAVAGYGTQFAGDELDDGDYLADSPAEKQSPKSDEKPATPKGNKQATQKNPPKSSIAEWDKIVYAESRFLYEHDKHQLNSIAALLKNKVISRDDVPALTIVKLMMHRAMADYSIDDNEFKTMLGGSVSSFLKEHDNSYQAAWEQIVVQANDKFPA